MSKTNPNKNVKVSNLPENLQPIAAQSKSSYHPRGGDGN